MCVPLDALGRQAIMAKTAKKVVLFIVEGPTDENAFSGVMKELYAQQRVVFRVVHGDITADKSVNAQNAISAVNQQVKDQMKKYGLHKTDILQIIHLTDTDGAFVPEESIRYGAAEKLVYGLDEICVPDGDHIAERNRKKSEVMTKLSSTKEVATIPYRLYYLSRNLEHVLFNDMADLTNSQKMDYADRFSDRYSEDVDGFVTYMSKSEFTAPGNYRETWQFIAKGTNSLHRWCNLHLALAPNWSTNEQ